MTFLCACGYDWETQAGNEGDSAVCKECGFTANGPHSGHAGGHHWIGTGHGWTLWRRTSDSEVERKR